MKISDSHTDFLTAIKNIEEREKYVSKIKSLGAKNISCAIFTTDKNMTMQDVITYSKELDWLQNKYGINLLLSIEDLGFIKNKEELQQIISLHPISVTLTWNYANQFGGGAHSNIGLSDWGKHCVSLLEQNNIFIDTAHMSRKSFWNFCKITKFPIFNSHSNLYALKRNARNLTDKQIEQIVKSNGYLGLTLYDRFISNSKISCKDIALQYDYLIKRFGYRNFGLGTDLYGVETNHLPYDIKDYGGILKLANELRSLGYSHKIVDCILYRNFENFLKNKYVKCYSKPVI